MLQHDQRHHNYRLILNSTQKSTMPILAVPAYLSTGKIETKRKNKDQSASIIMSWKPNHP
jgi:hypothetical protein